MIFIILLAAAAAAAKLLQSCPTLCNPIDNSPPGSSVPGILQARTLEWVAISFSNAWKWKVQVKLLSRVRPSVTQWTAVFQAPPSMGFSRQEYWSGVPLPSPYSWQKGRKHFFILSFSQGLVNSWSGRAWDFYTKTELAGFLSNILTFPFKSRNYCMWPLSLTHSKGWLISFPTPPLTLPINILSFLGPSQIHRLHL